MTLHCEHALFLHECFFNFVFLLPAMDGKIEQHVCIEFCVKLGKSTIETLEMLCKVFGEHSLGQTVVFEWHSRFKAGGVSIEDDKATKHRQNNRKC
jgi:hypothetical protein